MKFNYFLLSMTKVQWLMLLFLTELDLLMYFLSIRIYLLDNVYYGLWLSKVGVYIYMCVVHVLMFDEQCHVQQAVTPLALSVGPVIITALQDDKVVSDHHRSSLLAGIMNHHTLLSHQGWRHWCFMTNPSMHSPFHSRLSHLPPSPSKDTHKQLVPALNPSISDICFVHTLASGF